MANCSLLVCLILLVSNYRMLANGSAVVKSFDEVLSPNVSSTSDPCKGFVCGPGEICRAVDIASCISPPCAKAKQPKCTHVCEGIVCPEGEKCLPLNTLSDGDLMIFYDPLPWHETPDYDDPREYCALFPSQAGTEACPPLKVIHTCVSQNVNDTPQLYQYPLDPCDRFVCEFGEA